MRIPRISDRDRRALRLAAVLLGPLVAWGWGVRPYAQALGQARQDLAAERDLLRRELSLVGAAPEYPASFEEGARRLLAAADRLLGTADDGAASAELTTYVQRLGELGEVHLLRIEPTPPRDAGDGLAAITVRVSGEGDLEGFLSLLRMLEVGPKLVHVDRFQLQGSGAAGWNQASPEALSFQFDATGFRLSLPADEGTP